MLHIVKGRFVVKLCDMGERAVAVSWLRVKEGKCLANGSPMCNREEFGCAGCSSRQINVVLYKERKEEMLGCEGGQI